MVKSEKEKAFADSLGKIVMARLAIIDTKLPYGVIDCPVCLAEKSLHFRVAKRNGHVHGKCKTKKCVNWME